jgi:hypothetical protein
VKSPLLSLKGPVKLIWIDLTPDCVLDVAPNCIQTSYSRGTYAPDAKYDICVDGLHGSAGTGCLPRKKRKLSIGDNESISEAEQPQDSAPGHKLAPSFGKGQLRQYFAGLRLPELLNPKSAYHGYVPGLPISDEESILEDIVVCLSLYLHFAIAKLSNPRQGRNCRMRARAKVEFLPSSKQIWNSSASIDHTNSSNG